MLPSTRRALISLKTAFAVIVTNAPVSGLVWVSTKPPCGNESRQYIRYRDGVNGFVYIARQ
jgi:hypothetical protein